MTPEQQAEVRRRALPVIAAYRDGGCELPPAPSAELAEEMMSFLACAPVDPRVVPMFLEDLHLDGADSGAIEWGDEVPAEVQGRRPHRRDRLRRGRPSRRHPPGPGRRAVHHRREERRPRRHVVGQPLSGCARRHRQPLLLLLVRAVRPLDRVLRPAARAAASTSSGCSTSYDIRPHCRFETEVVGAVYDEATAPLGRHHQGADGDRGGARRPLRDQRGGFAQPARSCPTSRAWTTSPARRSTPPGGIPSVDLEGHARRARRRRRQRLPDRAHHRRRGREPHHLPAHRAVDVPERRCTTRQVPSASAGRCGTCRSTAAGSGSSPSTRRRASRWTATASTPSGDDRRPLHQRGERADPRALRRVHRVAARRTGPTCSEASIPHYPPSAKRMLQDNGSWLACLKKPNVELVRTGIERIVPEGIVTVDGVLREVDVICYATGFRHNDFLWPLHIVGTGRRDAARAVGRRAHGLPRHHRAELPEPVLPLRPGHQPAPTAPASSSSRSARSTTP